jgi:hypothetical protein
MWVPVETTQLASVLRRAADEALDSDGCFFFLNAGAAIIYTDFGIVTYVCNK